MLTMKISAQRAFTLLEVLVAMAVLTLGMITLVKVSGQNTIQTIYLKDKTLAQWVAVNKINEVKLENNWPDLGTSRGVEEDFANQNWEWELKVLKHIPKKIRKLEIEVKHEGRENKPLIKFISFVGK